MEHDSQSANVEAPSEPYLTLGQASRLAPGHPSTNSLWRWARKGVYARSGQRVRLQHLRIGGKIFTTVAWIEEFGRKLAEADAAHFDRANESCHVSPAAGSHHDETRRAHLAQVDAELRKAGI